jgi:hypothetical protein
MFFISATQTYVSVNIIALCIGRYNEWRVKRDLNTAASQERGVWEESYLLAA